MRKYYATCSTDERVQIVGPFPDILEVTEYGFKWSVKNNHETRWHVLYTIDADVVIEHLNPHKAFVMLGFHDYAQKYRGDGHVIKGDGEGA